jgi:hypothetical protein
MVRGAAATCPTCGRGDLPPAALPSAAAVAAACAKALPTVIDDGHVVRCHHRGRAEAWHDRRLLEVMDLAKRFPVKTPHGQGLLHAVGWGELSHRSRARRSGWWASRAAAKSTLVRLLTRTLR